LICVDQFKAFENRKTSGIHRHATRIERTKKGEVFVSDPHLRNDLFSRGSLLAGLAAVLVVIIAYMLSQSPELSDETYHDLAKRFAFERTVLPVVSQKEPQRIRQVHPSLKHLAAWTSFVGGAVSIGDLDGDGFANDVAYVDTRFDEVTICPALESDHRYPPFILPMAGIPFNTETVAPMGTRFGDFNEDGVLDILVYFWGRSPILCLQSLPSESPSKNLSASQFIATDLVSPHQIWNTSCVTPADLNGDGRIDLLIGNYNPDGAKTLDSSDASGTEVMMGSWARAENGGTTHILLREASQSSPTLFSEVKNVLPPNAATG